MIDFVKAGKGQIALLRQMSEVSPQQLEVVMKRAMNGEFNDLVVVGEEEFTVLEN